MNRFKRVFSQLLHIFLSLTMFGNSVLPTAILLTPPRVNHQNQLGITTVSVQPIVSTVPVGDRFTITVDVSSILPVGLSGFQFDLVYDPTLIALVDIAPGDLLASTGRTVTCPQPAFVGKETLRYACATSGSQPWAQENGTLANLTFVALAVGQSQLKLSTAQLTGPGSPPLATQPTVQAGTVNIVPPAKKVAGRSLSLVSASDPVVNPVEMTADFSQTSLPTMARGFASVPPATVVAPLTTTCYATDLDCDQDVDTADLVLMAGYWNCATTMLCFDAAYDFDSSGLIDVIDLAWVGNDYDVVPPAITILSPANGAVIGGPQLTITGQVSDTQHAITQLTINDIPVPLMGGNAFAATLNLSSSLVLSSSNQLITIMAENTLGQIGILEWIVSLDNEGPVIDIHEPKNRQAVYSLTPTIAISYTDYYTDVDSSSLTALLTPAAGSTIDITNDLLVTAKGAQGVVTLPLVEDMSYTLTVSVADTYGNNQTAHSTFYVPINPGAITPPVIEPTSGWVSGVVYDSSTCTEDLNQCQGLAGATVTLSVVDMAALADVQATRAQELAATTLANPLDPAVAATFATPVTGTAITGPDGFFAFPVSETNIYWLRIEKDNFTYAQREAEVVREKSTATNAIYLTPLDTAVTPCDETGCTHTNSDNSIQLQIPPGAIPPGQTENIHATNFEQVEFLPSGELPPGTWETYAFNLGGASELTFTKPITVRVANTIGFSPGTSIPLGYWNQVTQQWEHAGTGVVEASGQWVEMQVIHFSNYDCNDPIAEPDLEIDVEQYDEEDAPCNGEEGCFISYNSGTFEEWVDLPPVMVMGEPVAPQLRYNSDRAYATEVIDLGVNVASVNDAQLGNYIQWELYIAGERTETYTFDASLTVGSEIGRYRYLWDGRDAQGEALPPGVYNYTINLYIPYIGQYCYALDGIFGNPPDCTNGATGIFVNAVKQEVVRGTVTLLGEPDSPFGTGWALNGLQRLYEDEQGQIVIDEGDAHPVEYYAPFNNVLLPTSGNTTASMNAPGSNPQPVEANALDEQTEGLNTETSNPIHSRRGKRHSQHKRNPWPLRKDLFVTTVALPTQQTTVGGAITSDTTWTLANSPYIVTSDVTVNSNVVLTIEAGVEVRFSTSRGLFVEGTLQAVGTSNDPIRFVSDQATPAAGTWAGVFLDSDSDASELAYCEVSHAGSARYWHNVYRRNNVALFESDAHVHHCTISHSLSRGIRVDAGSPNLHDNTVVDNGSQGMWLRSGTTATVNDNLIENNGQDGIYIEATTPSLTGNTIQNNGDAGLELVAVAAPTLASNAIFSNTYPVRLDGNTAVPTLVGNTFAGNTHEVIGVNGSDITISRTWAVELFPYRVLAHLTVANGGTLTIDPGVEVQFGTSQGLFVQGTLQAVGTSNDPIRFVSSQATPTAGSWAGVFLDSNSDASELAYCEVSHAGSAHYWHDVYRRNNVALFESDAHVHHCTINHSLSRGIRVDAGSPNLHDNTVIDNGSQGMWLRSGTTATVNDNLIENNSQDGIYIEAATPSLTGNTIQNNGDAGLELVAVAAPTLASNAILSNTYPVRLDGNTAVPTLVGNTFAGNTHEVIGVNGSDITISRTWAVELFPYRVLAHLTVANGGTLTIDPGVEVQFGTSQGLFVEGTLQAIGTSNDPIRFVSSQATPTAGSWAGVFLDSDSDASELAYCEVSHAGSAHYWHNVYRRNNVALFESDAHVHNCTINHSLSRGIRVDAGSPNLHDNTVIDNGSQGMWLRSGTTATVNDNLIENNGQDGIYIEASTPSLTGNTIQNNGDAGLELVAVAAPTLASNAIFSNTYPVRLDGNTAVPTLVGNTFAGNTHEVIGVNGSDITISRTWAVELFPYRVLAHLTVANGGTLTIDPGVEVQFGTSQGLFVQGILQAVGTSNDPIRFVSSQATPTAGSWAGVFLDSNSDASELAYCEVSHAGSAHYWHNVYRRNNVALFESDAHVHHCTINHSLSRGIRVDAGSPNLHDNTVVDNGSQGMWLRSGTTATVNDNLIENNSQDGIYIEAATPSLTGNTIQNNSDAGLELVAVAAPTLDNNTIVNNAYPLRLDPNTAVPTLAGNSLNGNTTDVIGVNGGTMSISRTWAMELFPYRVLAHLTIANDTTLTIDPGVDVQFSSYQGLFVQGTLQAVGTSTAPINFISHKETPVASDWAGIFFDSDSDASQLAYCHVSHAGNATFWRNAYRYSNLTLFESDVQIFECGIHHSYQHGILSISAAPTVLNSEIRDNGSQGVWATGSNTPIINQTGIFANANYGVLNQTGQLMEAGNNWWGDASGPYHAELNPSGLGDAVSDDVDFTPWAQSADIDLNLGLNRTATDHTTLIYNVATETYTRYYLDGTEVHFHSNGRHAYTELTDGRQLNYTYNADGSVATMAIVPPGESVPQWTWTFAYNNGRLHSITDPAQRVTTFVINSQNNLMAATTPDGASQGFLYDDRHLLTHYTDQNGAVTTHVYDEYGRIKTVTEPTHPVHDPNTNQQTFTPRVRQFTTTDIGYPLINTSAVGTVSNPAPAVGLTVQMVIGVQYGHGQRTGQTNKWGAWESETDDLGRTTHYQRDEANNITKMVYPDGDCAEYTYDETSNVLTEAYMAASQCDLPEAERDD